MTRYARHTAAGTARMVENEAGGLSFKLDHWSRYQRFLILGAEGGTYYVGEPKLTRENAEAAMQALAEDPYRYLGELQRVHEKGLAPKWQPAVFCLALASAHGDIRAKAWVRENASGLLRTGAQLLAFVASADALGKWRRNLRSTVAKWFQDRTADQLAYQAIKYQQRDGWAMRDVLRLSHVKHRTAAEQGVFERILGKAFTVSTSDLPLTLRDEMRMRDAVNESGDQAALGYATVLPREALPSTLNAMPHYWRAAAAHLPATAMIRNLAQMTRTGALGNSETKAAILRRLGDQLSLQAARVHPLQLLLAAVTYAKGGAAGRSSGATYTPDAQVLEACFQAFERAFSKVHAIPGKVLVAVDVSDSMGAPVNGSPSLTCKEAAAGIAVALDRMCVDADVLPFSTECPATFSNRGMYRALGVGAMTFIPGRGWVPTLDKPMEGAHGPLQPGASYQHALAYFGAMDGGTRCSSPIEYALREGKAYDAIVILSDEQTWADQRPVAKVMEEYRKKVSKGAKLAVLGLSGTGTTLVDPLDPLALGIAGFDGSAAEVLQIFLSGKM